MCMNCCSQHFVWKPFVLRIRCRAAGLGGVSLWLCRGEGTESTDTVIDYLYLLHMEQMSVTLHIHTAG